MSPLDPPEVLIERPEWLQLYRFGTLVNRVPAPWLIRGVLRQESVSLLYGKRGCYKSFVALDMAASLATGLPWQDHDIVSQGLVVYVAGEGGGGMVQRARAWAEQHQIQPATINMWFVTEPVTITADSVDMDVLIHRIKEIIGWEDAGNIDEQTGEQYETPVAREWPVLIVIDTLARCFAGDENKQEFMGAFIRGVDRLRHEFNTSVLIVHHSGLDGSRERGSTALGGACDTIYKLEAEEEGDLLTLINEKMKDSTEPDPLELTHHIVTITRARGDDPDEELTSVVIGVGLSPKTDEELLDLLREKPLTYTQWLAKARMAHTTFNRRISALRGLGKIISENGRYRAP